MTPEGKVKAYLMKRVKEEGGETRAVQWIGRNHCPDLRVMLPEICVWVETKPPSKKPQVRAGQIREHARMRKYGEIVVVLHTKEAVDVWLSKIQQKAVDEANACIDEANVWFAQIAPVGLV